MPDPLSLVATILQLIDTTVKTRDYVVGFRDAPEDQQNFLAELQNFGRLLGGFETRIRANNSVGLASCIHQLKEPLIRLAATMAHLTKKLDTKGGFAKACQRLTWPLWGKKQIQEGLNTIERFKTLLGTWLTIDIWDVSRSHTQETHDAGGEEENITEYDNSSEGRARLFAMHARVEQWARQTAAAPSLRSPFTPRSHASSSFYTSHSRSDTGYHSHSSIGYTAHSASDITRPSQYGGTQRQSTHRSHRQYLQGSHAASTHNSRPPTSHSFHSHDGASSISPSESISLMGSPSPTSDSPYHQSSHHPRRCSHYSLEYSSHHGGRGGSRPPAVYVVAPASSLSANGMVIFPRWGQAPSVVYY